MTKPVILTGIRANNDLTIGNYFGAILPIIDMAKKRSADYQINMFIPDLHSFTTPIDHDLLYDQILHNARLFIAAGLPIDNDSIYLYRQSYIPAHSEMTWILDCFTGFGEMRRMTQFKEKSKAQKHTEDIQTKIEETTLGLKSINANLSALKNQGSINLDTTDVILDNYMETTENLFKLIEAQKSYTDKSENLDASVGLFNYPVLMAADILLYNAKYIPVGEDQTQHLEFARDIAERINKRFNDEIFTVPEPVKSQHEFFGNDQGLRIKDLIDPTKKMSKSDESGRGVIFLGDEPAVAAKKIMGATTDDLAKINFDKKNQPGISNLLEILALIRGTSLETVINEFQGQTRYGDFKKVVADEVEKFLTDFQDRLTQVDDSQMIAKLEQSERALTITADATLLRAQQAVGLRQRV